MLANPFNYYQDEKFVIEIKRNEISLTSISLALIDHYGFILLVDFFIYFLSWRFNFPALVIKQLRLGEAREAGEWVPTLAEWWNDPSRALARRRGVSRNQSQLVDRAVTVVLVIASSPVFCFPTRDERARTAISEESRANTTFPTTKCRPSPEQAQWACVKRESTRWALQWRRCLFICRWVRSTCFSVRFAYQRAGPA